MTWKFFCLILSIVNTISAHCEENRTDGEFQIPEIPETLEFISEEQNRINKFNDPIYRRIFKNDLREMEFELKKNALVKLEQWDNFIVHFINGIADIKVSLQHVLDDAKRLYFQPALSDVEYPPDFVSLNKTHDRWIDDETDKEQDNPFQYKNYKPPTARIEKAFKLYYNLFSTPPSDLPYQNYFNASIIQEKLKNIYIKNPTKYPNMETVYIRFAASMARSSRMAYIMSLISTFKLWHLCGPEQEFTDVFFGLIGTWYLTKEHMMFINLLKEASGHSLLLRSIPARNKKNEWVEIPFLWFGRLRTIIEIR